MAAELHVLSGDRAGLVLALDGAECTVGRHPQSALRFGADAERGVSARHARLVRDGAGWRLHDLGSTNGTWLNGRRVEGDAALQDGDCIAFGAAGPVAEFRDSAARPSPPPAATRPRTKRIAGRYGAMGAAAACVLLASAAAGIQLIRRPLPAASAGLPASIDPEAAAERQGADGLHPTSASLPSRSAPPPAPAPAAAPRPIRPPASRVDGRAAPGAVAVSDSAAAAPEPAEVPARPLAVDRRNRLAVARIYVEGEDGEVSTGTAFSVRADGTLVTSRHVVAGRPRRIAVQFAASSQVWRARVVAVSGEWDLAAVRVDGIVGAVPTVLGLNLRPDTLAEGAPLALVGFPRGGDPVEGVPARPGLSQAEFARVRNGRVEVYARSAVGASGSPLFDADGRVVGILFGGAPGGERPLLYAVPASAIGRL